METPAFPRPAHLVLACTLLLSACNAGSFQAQADAGARAFTPDELREDLEYLRSEYEARHPRRHGAAVDPALEQAFEDVALSLDAPMDRRGRSSASV